MRWRLENSEAKTFPNIAKERWQIQFQVHHFEEKSKEGKMGKFNTSVPSKFSVFRPVNKLSAMGVFHTDETVIQKKKTIFEEAFDFFKILESSIISYNKAIKNNGIFISATERRSLEKKQREQLVVKTQSLLEN